MRSLIPILLALVCYIAFGEEKEDIELYNYMDRTCDGVDCFADIMQGHGDCKLSADKTVCSHKTESGDNNKCKFIGNSNMRMCIDPNVMHQDQMNYDDLFVLVSERSVSWGSQQLCLYDDNGNLEDILCKRANGTRCDQYSKKCVMNETQVKKMDDLMETRKSAYHRLPYNYTNDLLIVVDGTGTRSSFEDPDKSYNIYGMKASARTKNGNWANHACNFYEDYRGAKYYWYGPNSVVNVISAGDEVKKIINGVEKTVCAFIGNHSDSSISLNIDMIGYSRGGYAIMESARKLYRDGCNNKKIKNIRFMGLYDPVSSVYGDVVGPNDDPGWFGGYISTTMPINVDAIAVSYGNENLGSRPGFKTCDHDDDHDNEKIKRSYFNSTHGGIGGSPGVYCAKEDIGDFERVEARQADGVYARVRRFFYSGMGVKHVKGYGIEMEENESKRADIHIRSAAKENGLPIDITTEQYYVFDTNSPKSAGEIRQDHKDEL